MYLLIENASYNCSLTLEGILSAKNLQLLLFHSIITHIYHIKFEVSLHFRRIWPTVRRPHCIKILNFFLISFTLIVEEIRFQKDLKEIKGVCKRKIILSCYKSPGKPKNRQFVFGIWGFVQTGSYLLFQIVWNNFHHENKWNRYASYDLFGLVLRHGK